MPSEYAGYTGNVMLVDLSDGSVQAYPWSDALRRQYLGGKAMGLRLLYDLLTGKEQALSGENRIVIATGPLTGSGAPSACRYDIATVSPMTGLPAASNCGGDFGLWLKRAGYDALILTGRCSEPRWLEIRDGRFLLHDAGDLWGTDTDVCRARLAAHMGDEKHGCLCIGPAGETAAAFACVADGTHTSGRSGIGAVLGWKRLKAIAVTGTQPMAVHAPKKVAALRKDAYRLLHSHPLTGKHSRSGSPTAKPCPGCPILCRRQFHKAADSLTALCDRLGMDAGSALDAADWAYAAAAQGAFPWQLPDKARLLTDIALGRDAGQALARGVGYLRKEYGFTPPKQAGAAQNRPNRDEGFHRLLSGWGLEPDTLPPSLLLDCTVLYLQLCEALSAAGLCVFTVNAFCPQWLLTEPTALRSRLLRRAVTAHAAGFLRRTVRKPESLRLPLALFWHTKFLAAVSGLKLTPGQFLRAGARCLALEQLLSLRFGGDPESLPKLVAGEKCCTPGEYFAALGWSGRGAPPAL